LASGWSSAPADGRNYDCDRCREVPEDYEIPEDDENNGDYFFTHEAFGDIAVEVYTETEEDEDEVENAEYGDPVWRFWRIGSQLWLQTDWGNNGHGEGKMIDYSVDPRAIFNWSRRDGETNLIKLPDNTRLLFWRI